MRANNYKWGSLKQAMVRIIVTKRTLHLFSAPSLVMNTSKWLLRNISQYTHILTHTHKNCRHGYSHTLPPSFIHPLFSLSLPHLTLLSLPISLFLPHAPSLQQAVISFHGDSWGSIIAGWELLLGSFSERRRRRHCLDSLFWMVPGSGRESVGQEEPFFLG